MSAVADWLGEVQWVQALPPGARAAVYADAYETRHAKGEAVARPGDPPTSWIGVADGLLKVSAVDREGRGITFAGAPRGSWIGEGAVVRSESRRYDIIAVRESRLIHIPSRTFRQLLNDSREFRRVVLAHLNERVGQLIEMMEIGRLHDPVARVARMLGTAFDPALYPRMGAALPLSQGELAEWVGLSRQCTGAALKQLAHQGLIATAPGTVLLRDIARLKGYVGRARQPMRAST